MVTENSCMNFRNSFLINQCPSCEHKLFLLLEVCTLVSDMICTGINIPTKRKEVFILHSDNLAYSTGLI